VLTFLLLTSLCSSINKIFSAISFAFGLTATLEIISSPIPCKPPTFVAINSLSQAIASNVDKVVPSEKIVGVST